MDSKAEKKGVDDWR